MASLTTTSITGDLSVSGSTSILMPGVIGIFACAVPPAGYLECNGAAISRTVYAALFGKVGTIYGAGNGSTTFAIPDLRGEFIRGWDHGRGVDGARSIGSAQSDEFRTHQHITINMRGDQSDTAGQFAFGDLASVTKTAGNVPFIPAVPQAYSSFAGGSETRPRNTTLLYCIRY